MKLGAIERPLVSHAVREPVLGPQHGAATHLAEFKPIMSPHGCIGAEFVRIICDGTGNVRSSAKKVPVHKNRQLRVKRSFQSARAVGEMPPGTPRKEAYRPIENPLGSEVIGLALPG